MCVIIDEFVVNFKSICICDNRTLSFNRSHPPQYEKA